MGFIENFRSELDYQGIPLKEFSAKSGISLNTLNKYQPGTNLVPSIETAQKIASALKVSLDYLATGKSAESEILSPEIMEMAKKMRNLNETEIEAIGKIIDALVQKK